MRPAFLALGVILVLAGWADAQTAPPVVPPNYSSPAYSSQVNDGTGGVAPGRPFAAVPYEPPWSVDLLLGLPTGVRFQRSLGDDIGRDWLIEGFVGLDFVIFPTVGCGLRRRLMALRGEHDALVLSPGVGAYLLYNTLHDGSLGWFGGGPTTAEMLRARCRYSLAARFQRTLWRKLWRPARRRRWPGANTWASCLSSACSLACGFDGFFRRKASGLGKGDGHVS